MTKKKPIDISRLKDAKTQFIKALNAVHDKELAAKIKAEGPGAVLTKDEISALRNHPDLGLWNSKGNPISVEGVRAHFRWRDQNQAHRKKTSPLTLKEVKPEQIEGYTRPYLESQKSITREAERWIKRLDGEAWTDRNGKLHPATGVSSWPPGLTKKNIWNAIGKAAEETGDYNTKLAAETGFSFQKGHGWGVMGPANKRTWVVPYYGARMEGHFNYRNVAPQPTGPSIAQLLHPFWNSIIPNVPSAGSPHGVQISSAEELRWAGGGGQGWSGTMADNLLRAMPDANIDDFDQLPLEQKAYVLFADPDKGGGANPEARYFEIKNGQWPRILKRVSHFASKSEDYMPKDVEGNLINQPRTIPKGSKEWHKIMGEQARDLFKKGSATLNKFSSATTDFMGELFPTNEGGGVKAQGDGTAVLTDEAVLPRTVNIPKLNELSINNLSKQFTKNLASSVGPTNIAANVALNPSLMQQVGARVHKGTPIDWKGFGTELGKDVAWDTLFGGVTMAALKRLGPAAPAFLVKPVYSAVDAYVEGATDESITDRYNRYRKNQQPFSDKKVKEAGLAPISEYNFPSGEYNDQGEYSIQIKKTEPRFPVLNRF